MERSQSIVNLSQALLKAQLEIEGAVKGNANAFFKSKYSDFNSVKEACKDQLNKHGIVVVQMIDSEGEHQYVVTQFIHAETGEFLLSKTPLNIDVKDNIQGIMSKTTYCKRYALQTMAFLGSVDDDAESGVGRDTNFKVKPPTLPTTLAPETTQPDTKRGFGNKPKTGGVAEWN